MKSQILVLLESGTNNISESLGISLERHRLNEDDIESIRSYHWDYWVFPAGESIGDSELQTGYPNEELDVLANSSYVRNLPVNYIAAGVIGIDGKWSDLREYGWKLINEPSKDNSIALDKWKEKFNELLSKNKDEICVQVIIHC